MTHLSKFISSCACLLAVGGATSTALFARSVSANPQQDAPKTLLGDDVSITGYGGVSTAYTRMFGRNGALIGLEGAMLLNRQLALGVAAYGFTNPAVAPVLDDIDRELEVGYGGGVLRYSIPTGLPVYVTVGSLFGGGSIVAAPVTDEWDEPGLDDEEAIERRHVDVFAVVQPELTVHANLTRWMRVGASASYRAAWAVDRFELENDDISGFAFGGNLQFGSF